MAGKLRQHEVKKPLHFSIFAQLCALRRLFAISDGALTFAALLLALAMFLLSDAAVWADAQRALTPEDVLHLEALGEAVFSPDGQWLAYVRVRPKATGTKLHWSKLDRSDIWLVATHGGTARNLTNGVAAEVGYWLPTWSPDSKRIAMFSTQENGTRLWVWEMESKRLHQVTDRFMTSEPNISWLSDRRLVCTVLPEEATPEPITEDQTIRESIRKRSEALQEQGPTVSVLYSGVATSLDHRPQDELLFIDLDAARSQELSSAASFGDVRVAPNRQHIAFLRQSGIVQPKQGALDHSAWRNGRVYRVDVADSTGKVISIDSDANDNVISDSLRWSSDSSEIAFVRENPSRTRPSFSVIRCQVKHWGCTTISLVGEVIRTKPSDGAPLPPGIMWAGKNDLLVYAALDNPTETGDRTERWDWWVALRNAEARNLTAGMKRVPSQLFAEGGESVVGLADGKLWRLWLDGNRQAKPFGPKIASVLWPRGRGTHEEFVEGGLTDIVVTESHDSPQRGSDFFKLNLTSGRTTHLNAPTLDARLADFSLAGDVAVFTCRNRTGTYLWLSQSGDAIPNLIVATNTFLSGIAEGSLRSIDYQSSDGEDLKAWLLLPAGFEEGQRYPLVTWVYAGLLMSASPPGLYELNDDNPLNLQLLAGRDYAVLFPSMPLKPVGKRSDPYMELSKGVLPAIDKVIEMGIADPKRLGVMGHSYGGYTTYGLVAQTNRFQAAIAMAGPADLASMYGSFDPILRYEPFPQQNLHSLRWTEGGQGRMGNPPWNDSGRFMRNSPLFYVDNVETPLMIVQGDFDFTPMQQGEEFYTALYRQGKRAQFVRYWGEGHIIEKAANVCDMWQRIYAWLDEFLDILRDPQGKMLWEGNKARSRAGAPPLKPEAFGQFDKTVRDGTATKN